MKTIIAMTLLLCLAAPAALADAKSDLCESYRLGFKGYEGIERDYPGVLDAFIFDLPGKKTAYRNICGPGTVSLDRLPSDFVCSAARNWHSGVSAWVKPRSMPWFKLFRATMADFEEATLYGLKAMGQLCR